MNYVQGTTPGDLSPEDLAGVELETALALRAKAQAIEAWSGLQAIGAEHEATIFPERLTDILVAPEMLIVIETDVRGREVTIRRTTGEAGTFAPGVLIDAYAQSMRARIITTPSAPVGALA